MAEILENPWLPVRRRPQREEDEEEEERASWIWRSLFLGLYGGFILFILSFPRVLILLIIL